MNVVVIGFLLAFLQGGSYVSAFVAEISDEDATRACMAELKLDLSVITTLDVLENYDESNPNCGKLLSCTWKKLGLQDDNGNINFDKLKNYLADFSQQRVDAGLSTHAASESMVSEWLENCRSLQGADHGQTALKVHFCLVKGIKKFIKSH